MRQIMWRLTSLLSWKFTPGAPAGIAFIQDDDFWIVQVASPECHLSEYMFGVRRP